MNCKHTVFPVRQDLYISFSVLLHIYDFAGTLVVYLIPRNNVAVNARLQTRVKCLPEIESVVVDSDESVLSATEGDLILAVVPPALNVGVVRDISESHHVVNLTPSMLADETVAAGVIGIDDRRQKIAVYILGRSVVEIVEAEGTHDARVSVRMGQHESNGHLQTRSLAIEKPRS